MNKMYEISNVLLKADKNIHFSGVGKSGNIAKHCCDLLNSIGYRAFYIDPLNALHGDIGIVTDKDVLIYCITF